MTYTADEAKTGQSTFAIERRAAMISFVVGVALMMLKFAAYIITGSSAVLSDALESIVNILAGGFALWAINYSHQPADPKHPYGHGKVEFLSAAIEGSMIVLAAIVIATRAMQDLVAGAVIQKVGLGILLIALAMVVNGGLGLYLIRSGRRGGSIALEADGHHLMTDAVTSAVVLFTLVLVSLTHIAWFDPICALVVAFYIAWMGLRLIRRSAAGLMDEQDPADDSLIRSVLDSHLAPSGKEPQICSYHKLRHRHTGRYHWVDFHLVVPKDWDIAHGHAAASFIEHQIEQVLEYTDATAHVEPCIKGECPRCPVLNVGP